MKSIQKKLEEPSAFIGRRQVCRVVWVVDYIILVMLVQSAVLARVLADKILLIELIDKLLSDILNDTRHLERGSSMFHCKQPPSISVGDYLKRIAKFANASNSIFVLSLIYIDRMQQSIQNFVINSFCIHRLLITTVMIAAKYADDFFYKNEYYAKIGGISKLEINSLEIQLLKNLNYHLYISESEFMVYLDRLEAYREVNQSQAEKQKAV